MVMLWERIKGKRISDRFLHCNSLHLLTAGKDIFQASSVLTEENGETYWAL